MHTNISLESLAVLDAVDRRGSFAAASEELFRVPSAITYNVRKLEQSLGVKVFDRRGHRAVLTQAGRELLRAGRELLAAARETEARVRRVATGWEAELRLAVDGMIGAARLLPLIARFYRERHATRIRITSEVYGGCWDALATGRADLAVGAPGEAPPGGGFATRPLGAASFAFVAAPMHPLARAPEPLRRADIQRHRAVSAADSSRRLEPRTSGLFAGQEVLTVPDLASKLAAHHAGLGVGFLPRWLAERETRAGRLVIKRVEEPKQDVELWIAWRSEHWGRALRWFVRQLSDQATRARLLGADSRGVRRRRAVRAAGPPGRNGYATRLL